MLVASSVEDALRLAGDVPETVVIGGGDVFRSALPYVNWIYLTLVEGEFKGTAFFPADIPTAAGCEWRETLREAYSADEKHRHPHCFVVVQTVESPRMTATTFLVPSLWR